MRRRLPALLGTVVLLAVALGPPSGSAATSLVVDRSPRRLAGPERTGTAAELATAAFPDGARTAVLATAAADADAVTAAALAGALDAPVILSAPQALSPAAAAALDRLGSAEVVVVGGADAVAAPVVEQVAATGREVRRVAGDRREETAAAVAEEVGATRVLLAATDDPAAAALAAGWMWAARLPLLLTGRDRLDPAAAAVLDGLPVEQVLLLTDLGGEVRAALTRRGLAVDEVYGDEGVAAAVTARRPATSRILLTAAGRVADALAAGPLAGRTGAALLPVGPRTIAHVASRCGTGLVMQALGGPAAVPESALTEVERAARACGPDSQPVRLRFAVAGDGDTAALAALLTDPRGWAEPGRVEWLGVTRDHDLGVVLVPGPCGGARGCRTGRDLLLDAAWWADAPEPERARLLNHLVGRWLGAAPQPCGPTVLAPPPCPQAPAWPTAPEREAVLDVYAPQITLAFAGDVHGERQIAAGLAAGRNPLDPVAERLAAADLAVVNLETPVSVRGTPAAKTFTFRAPPALLPALAAAGVDAVSVANNHALDYGYDAFADTLAFAAAAGVATLGGGANASAAYAPTVVKRPEGIVALLGLTRALHTRAWEAGPERPGLASAYDEAAAVAAVRAAAGVADLVVVAVHWGTERADCPDAAQLRLARLLSDAGADLIVGHHPHVLQGVARHGGTLVAYSLGNFVWYHDRVPSRFTGVLEVRWPFRGMPWTLHPAVIGPDGSPHPAAGPAAAAIRGRVADRSPGGVLGCAFSPGGSGGG